MHLQLHCSLSNWNWKNVIRECKISCSSSILAAACWDARDIRYSEEDVSSNSRNCGESTALSNNRTVFDMKSKRFNEFSNWIIASLSSFPLSPCTFGRLRLPLPQQFAKSSFYSGIRFDCCASVWVESIRAGSWVRSSALPTSPHYVLCTLLNILSPPGPGLEREHRHTHSKSTSISRTNRARRFNRRRGSLSILSMARQFVKIQREFDFFFLRFPFSKSIYTIFHRFALGLSVVGKFWSIAFKHR